MSLQPEIEFVKALLPRRSVILSVPSAKGGNSMSNPSTKSWVLRAAERHEQRLSQRGPWPRRFAVLGGAIVLTASTGVAMAAWTSTGSGTGYAKAGTMGDPTTTAVAASAITSGLLTPGGAAADVQITVNNPNGFSVKVTGVAGNGAITADSGHSGCTTTGVTFSDQTPSASNSIAAKGSSTLTLTGAASMSNSSFDACQGALFSIPVSVTLTSG